MIAVLCTIGKRSKQLTAARRDLRVLYITGYTDRPEWKLEARQVGQAYLQKPFTPSVLIRKVRDLLDATPHALVQT